MRILFVGKGIVPARGEMLSVFGRLFNAQIIFLTYYDWWSPEVYKYDFPWQRLDGLCFKIPFMLDGLIHWGGRRVLAIVNDFKPDIVIAVGYGSITTFRIAQWANRNKIPFGIWSENSPLQEKQRNVLVRLAKTEFVKRANLLIASSTPAKHHFLSLLPDADIYTVPYTVNVDHFKKGAELARLSLAQVRENFQIRQDSRLLLTVARLDPAKGVERLIYLLYELHKDVPDLYLAIAGSGPYESELKILAQDLGVLERVRFLGHIDHAELPYIYGMANLFILPSLKDTWGLVVNEAMSSGLPVIVSDQVGCATDLVLENETGYIFRINVNKELKEKVCFILKDTAAGQRMGRKGQQLMLAKYKHEHAAEQLFNAVMKTISSDRAK